MAKNLNIPELPFNHPERELHLYRYTKAKEFTYGKVLDVACGWGYGSFILKNPETQVTGIDNDLEAISYAKNHYPDIGFIEQDIEENSLPKVDYIVCLETVEHLKNPEEFIKKIKESADLIFLSTPCVPTVGANLDHLHDFTEDQVKEWFSDWETIFEENQINIYKLICARRKN